MITLFIPAYNEETIIRKNVTFVFEYIKKNKLPIQLIILNDGSTDNTKKILNTLKKKIDITVINDNGPSRRENLIKQMINVKTNYVGFMDCDLATDLSDLKNLVINIKNYDIVSGSRYLSSSTIKRSNTRKVISFLFNNSIKLLFRSKIRDHECGFKLFNTKAIKKIITYTGYGEHKKNRKMFWDTEMWIYAQNLNMKILEIPIIWHEGDKSALRFKTEIIMIPYIINFWVKREWMKKNLK